MRPALLVAVVVVSGCGSAGKPTTVAVGLTLEGETTAPTVHLSLDAAIARRDELRGDDPPPGIEAGERAWFFRAYDDDDLVFLEGRYHPYDDPRPTKRVGRYRIDRRVIVPRSERALDALGVRGEVEQREKGVCGVRTGMTAAEVQERYGTPTDVMYMQAAGCVVHHYDQLHVQLCHELVTDVSAERCP